MQNYASSQTILRRQCSIDRTNCAYIFYDRQLVSDALFF